jgi:hypothetical protein
MSWTPPDRRPHLSYMRTVDIYRELVDDGVRGVPTPLQRFVDAIKMIAAADGASQETVMRRIEGEVRAKTGRGLPL